MSRARMQLSMIHPLIACEWAACKSRHRRYTGPTVHGFSAQMRPLVPTLPVIYVLVAVQRQRLSLGSRSALCQAVAAAFASGMKEESSRVLVPEA